MIIDSHLHVWDPARSPYDWLHAAGGPLERRVDIDEVLPALDEVGVDGVVLVQADDADGDTDLMLEVAARCSRVLGVVAYVPLDDPRAAAARLEALQQNPWVVGVRTLMHIRQDPEWLLRSDVDAGLSLVEAAGLPFDLVGTLPRHLALVPAVSERHPALDIVLDHLAHPPIGAGDPRQWQELLGAAAENPRVRAKISGLYPAGEARGVPLAERIRPAVERALAVFGPSRLMYGGDWPVSTAHGSYAEIWSAIDATVAGLDAADRERITAGTALSFYAIDSQGLAAVRSSAITDESGIPR